MRFWIDKENEMLPNKKWEDAYIFTLIRKSYSTIFTNIADIWYRMDRLIIPEVYEDLFIIGVSIFALDKRVNRRMFPDCWTRNISVNIPVLEVERWKQTEEQWNKTLTFLTGDIWDIHFRNCEKQFSKRENPNRMHLNLGSCNCVSLFSAGLDSYCGAIKLLEDGNKPCLIGHNEYPKLKNKQNEFAETFRKIYPEQEMKFVNFTANSRAPKNLQGELLEGTENTSRGRSLLYLCTAISIAGILGQSVPVYIPENGFIGLNIPLTSSRKGTCSTRTTHPYFLNSFSKILKSVGIHNTINNFFAYSTKREIVNLVKDTEAFKSHYRETISCSHPCIARYNEKGNNEYPINCGYCYPCLIRKSSLVDARDFKYSFSAETKDFLNQYGKSEKSNDLRAVISAVYQYKYMQDGDIKSKIRLTGNLTEEDVDKFLRLYKSTMEDLYVLFSADIAIKKMLGE